MNVYQLALKEAIDSYQMVREWLDDPSKNRISIPQFKEFVSKLQNLQSAVSNVSSRKPVAVEPRQVVQEPIPVSPASLSSKPAKPQIPTVSNNKPIPMKPFEFTRQQQR